MKSQIAKRFNINLTEQELKSLESIQTYNKLNKIKINDSDCIRDAINAYGKKARIAISTGTDID